jgi:hypothetical protein
MAEPDHGRLHRDFGFGDLDGDGVPEVVVGVLPAGSIWRPWWASEGHLVLYELP